MFYTFSYTPNANDTIINPYELKMKLTAGVIHQVDILFQDGCKHQEFVQVYQAGHQLWPTNPGGMMRGNATAVSFREFHELERGEITLTAKIWTVLSVNFKELVIQIGVLPGKIIRPFQLEDLFNLAIGE